MTTRWAYRLLGDAGVAGWEPHRPVLSHAMGAPTADLGVDPVPVRGRAFTDVVSGLHRLRLRSGSVIDGCRSYSHRVVIGGGDGPFRDRLFPTWHGWGWLRGKARYEKSDHPIAAVEPGSAWRWCYVHRRLV